MAGIRIGGIAMLTPPDLDQAMIWNGSQVTGGTDQLFALGVPGVDLATYLGQSRVNTGQWVTRRPVLSPDISEYVYQEIDNGAAGTNRTRLRLCASDDLSAPTTLAEVPSSGAAVSGRGMEILGWSPDGQEVYWRGQVGNLAVDNAEIRKINRDGTGNTQIWNGGGSITSVDFGQYPRISPDGAMLAFWIDSGGSGGGFHGLWTMNEDGTNVQHIYTPPDSLGDTDFYGWSPDSEWLLFIDQEITPAPDEFTVLKCRPDGTDLTTLYSWVTGTDETMRLGQGQHSLWTTDGSEIVCARDTSPGSGVWEIGLLLTDGSETFTAIPPGYTTQSTEGYPVMNSDFKRVYWYTGAAVGTMEVQSAKLDGSDYRVDDNMVTVSAHDDYVADGWYLR